MDIELSPSQIVRIEKTEFKGKKYLDIRKYYWAEVEWRPTPKGITIPIEIAEKVVKAAQQALAEAPPKEEQKDDSSSQ